MRKTRSMIGAALVTGLVVPLAACGSGGGGSDDNTLTVQSVWTKGTAEGDALSKVIDQFTDETGAKVEWLDTGESLSDVYETSVAGGSEADLVLSNYAEKTVDWVKNGAVVPMDSYLKDWGLSDSIKGSAVDEWKDSDGKLVGLPFSGFLWPVWYNTDLLKKAGVDGIPATTDDLIAAAGKLRAAGIEPMAVGGNDWSGQKVFLQIAQSYADADTARETFTKGGFCAQPDIMKGIKLFTKLRDGGVFVDDAQGYSADATNAEYFNGKAAIVSAGSWAFGSDDLTPELAASTTLSGFPDPSDGGAYDKPTAYNGYTGVGVMLSPNGEKKADLAEKFVKLLYSSETVGDFVSTANLVPAATTGDDAKINNPLLEQGVNDLDSRVDYAVMPDASVPGAVADPMIRATSLAYSPGHDAASICKSIDDAYASVG
ncbi:ABC transporter substrate-binding protein [Cellulomonas sp. PhB143]|uniref:ABC transporter substrate-binding protein n=1 Tax=Cellulomonas sp. PhB143 TaxID=2485186 RepID=UPI000F975ADE|nr:ABC transporter substrate-binding protein [Cellulomonas sp. PhB143]ROS79137.1 carbohydrate ABC transporter substrate-binding protein (CUT1 family) [Cellulomonas sp. PhB143]